MCIHYDVFCSCSSYCWPHFFTIEPQLEISSPITFYIKLHSELQSFAASRTMKSEKFKIEIAAHKCVRNYLIFWTKIGGKKPILNNMSASLCNTILRFHKTMAIKEEIRSQSQSSSIYYMDIEIIYRYRLGFCWGCRFRSNFRARNPNNIGCELEAIK